MTLAEYHQHERPPMMRSARPHHVLVHVDCDVEKALRQFKKRFEQEGVRQMLRADGRLHAYQPPSVRRRKKAAAAATRARKAARQAAYREWRAELRGL